MATMSKKKKSAMMARLRAALVSAGFKGWTTRCQMPGPPDFAFEKERLAVFVHECFLHACRACRMRTPSTNRRHWMQKFEANVKRDRRTRLTLTRMGWRVITIWEHELDESTARCARKVAFNAFMDPSILGVHPRNHLKS